MNDSEDRIYSITYCSRNCIRGGLPEIRRELQEILEASRRNNAKAGVTGALLYNAGCFAQVLEGPLGHIQRIFEVIQRDPRHGEVTVIQSEFAAARQFPNWSMAFVGANSFQGSPEASDAFEAVFAGADDGAGQMLSLLCELLNEESEWLIAGSIVSC